MRRALLTGWLLAFALLAAGCGGGSPTSAGNKPGVGGEQGKGPMRTDKGGGAPVAPPPPPPPP